MGTKDARRKLGLVMADVETNIRIAKQTRRKHAYVAMMEILEKLQQAAQLNVTLK